MTEPSYPGSIRDDSNSGIRGLFAQLALIVAGLGSMPAILTQVTAINTLLQTNIPLLLTRLTYLSGTNAPQAAFGNRGLPGYMPDVIGTAVPDFGFLITLKDYAASNDTNVGELLRSLAGFATNQAGGSNQLVAQRILLERLSLVAGLLADTPSGATLKSLLAAGNTNTLRSAECCEDGAASTPPPDSSNPTPAGFCNGNALQRVVSWKFLNQQVVGGVNANVYRPVFNFSPAALLPLTGFDSSRPAPSGPAIQMPVNTNATYCIAWNFAGQFSPLTIGRYIGTSSDAAQDNIVTTDFLVGASTPTVGGESFDYNNCGGVASFLSFNAAFALGVTPPLSFFIGVSQNRGCPV